MPPDPVTSPSPLPSDKRLHWTVAFAFTTLAYALAAGLSQWLVTAPGHAPPLSPSAGIALVCTLVYGRRMALAAGLAAFVVHLALGQHHGMGMSALWPAAMIGAGAMAQALVGAMLVRRHVRFPMSLSEPRDIALFFVLGALVASLVSASATSLALGGSEAVPSHRLGFNWLTWWTSDALGVLVAAPIVLTLIGRPRREWAPRRLTVGLTLFLAGVLLALGLHQVARLENVVGHHQVDTWLLSLVGLGTATMLGALLLTVTGRTRRIEAAVNERTAALRQEVVEREHAEEALRESERRFRNIFNIVPIGVAYADLHGQLKQVNPRFCELVGYDAAEVLTMNAFDFTHPDDASQDVAWNRQLVLGEIDDFRRETRFIRKDGSVFWVKSTVSLLRDAAGHPSRIVAAVENITEHLLLGEAEQARKAAEAANTAKSEFLSRMSHELRTPLNAMLGFAQLLEMNSQHPLGPTQRPWVAQIQQAGWHLLDMINDVLDLSRIESGHLELHPQILKLQHLLSSTLPLVEQDARRRGIQISQDLAPDALLLEGDATRVKQILTNLLSNAVKYNTECGRIHVSAQRRQAMIEVTVTDTGLGMTPEQVDHLFQPFNRLGRDRSAIEGTGIGLVISRRLAELMGGALTVDSVPGQGSAFTLALPAMHEDAAPHSGHATLAEAEPAYNQRTVHYVEDNETNVEVMRGILALRPQIRLTVSKTGLEGLAAIRIHRPDVVLLDMHLPDITGIEVLEELKAEPLTADIPVVVVSADAVVSQIEAALDAGAVRYLTKPVGVSELLSSLDAVLDGVDTRFG